MLFKNILIIFPLSSYLFQIKCEEFPPHDVNKRILFEGEEYFYCSEIKPKIINLSQSKPKLKCTCSDKNRVSNFLKSLPSRVLFQ